jgi:hypothetical protein
VESCFGTVIMKYEQVPDVVRRLEVTIDTTIAGYSLSTRVRLPPIGSVARPAN